MVMFQLANGYLKTYARDCQSQSPLLSAGPKKAPARALCGLAFSTLGMVFCLVVCS